MNRTETNVRQKALREIQMATFSAIETTLYLDTHPRDPEAMAALEKYCAKRKDAIAAYEAEYGPITFCSCASRADDTARPYFRWALSPMPWEMEEC